MCYRGQDFRSKGKKHWMISEQWILGLWMTHCQLPSWALRAQLQFRHKQTPGCFSLWLLPLFIKNHRACFHPIKSTRGIQTFSLHENVLHCWGPKHSASSTCEEAAVSCALHSLIFLPSCVLLYSSTTHGWERSCVWEISCCYTHIHLCQTHVAVWQLLHFRGNPSHTGGGVVCEWVPLSPRRPERALDGNWQHLIVQISNLFVSLITVARIMLLQVRRRFLCSWISAFPVVIDAPCNGVLSSIPQLSAQPIMCVTTDGDTVGWMLLLLLLLLVMNTTVGKDTHTVHTQCMCDGLCTTGTNTE